MMNSKRSNLRIRIAVGITILVILLLAGGVQALSNSGGGSWNYYRDITINNTGGALSDYQVLVSLAGSAFPTNAQASGADVRFTDASGNELSYWIESWDYANRSARVWVNVTGIPAGASSMRMWYGNPSAASASSGTNTFDLFDNFDDNSLDSKWTTGTSNFNNAPTETSNKIQISGTGSGGYYWWSHSWIQTTNAFMNISQTGFVAEVDAQAVTGGNYAESFLMFYINNTNAAAISVYTESNVHEVQTWNSPTANVLHGRDGVTTNDWVGSYSSGNWEHIKLIFNSSNSNITAIADGNLSATRYTGWTSGLMYLRLSVAARTSSSVSGGFDNITVRKYSYPEPSVSVGAEQSASPLLQKIWQTNLSSTNLLWPAVGDLNGDGIKDVVTGTNTRIYALNGANGQTLWTYDFGSIWGLTWPTVKDVDGDGKIEVLVGSAETSSRTSPGKIIVLNNQGQVKWMYNLSVPPQEIATDDIDGDGKTEVIFGMGAPGPYGSVPGYVYVVNGTNGSFLWSFAGHNGHQMSRVATGDLNGDNIKEIIAGDWGWESPGSYVYAINGTTHNAIWSYWASSDVGQVVSGDINNDGRDDVILTHNTGQGTLTALNGLDGNLIWQYKQGSLTGFHSIIGDVTGDGSNEVASSYMASSGGAVYVFNGSNGNILWSYITAEQLGGSPAIGDINSDGRNEVISALNNLTIFNGINGNILQQIPLNATGRAVVSEDLNGDGTKEVIATDVSGNVYLFALTPISGGTVISIASQTVTLGSIVTVPIMANNITNVAAFTISLTYNPAVVVVNSVTAGTLGGVFANINNATGVTQMSAFTVTPQSGNVVLANAVLRAVGTAGQTSPLTLTVTTLSDNNGNTIPATVSSGTFNISPVKKGDVTGDGKVDITDALFIAQYTVGLRTLTPTQLAAGDVNCDGKVDITDALFIAQYTVGLRTTFC